MKVVCTTARSNERVSLSKIAPIGTEVSSTPVGFSVAASFHFGCTSNTHPGAASCNNLHKCAFDNFAI